MKLTALKDNQAKLKVGYTEKPETAFQSLMASGNVDFGNLAVILDRPEFLNPAGLHLASGGDGTFACPVEIMLAGLVSCAGVTMAAVATSMKLQIDSARVTCAGDMDFRGTLAVDRAAPVGLTAIRLTFQLETAEPDDKIARLIELTHRYCVVHRTLDSPPAIETEWKRG